MSAAITCKDPSGFVPKVTFSATPVSGSSSSSIVIIDSIAYKKVDTLGASFNYSATQAVPEFGVGWVLTSDTPSICTAQGDVIIRVSSGIGKVRVTGPDGTAVQYSLDFNSTTLTKYVWTGFSGVSNSSIFSNPTLSLLAPNKTKNYYLATWPLPAPLASGSSFVKNNDCWAAQLTLTGSPIATGLGGNVYPSNSGALITKRHWVGVRHWGTGSNNMGAGSNLTFVDSLGIIHVRTVLQRHIHTTKDIIVCLLDSDLPAGVTPFKLANVAMFDFPNRRAYGVGWKITQQKSVSLAVFDYVQSPQVPSYAVYPESVTWCDFADGSADQITDPEHLLYPSRSYLQEASGGDSGGAIGGYYNGETYLVSLFTGPKGGTLYSGNIASELNTIIASLDTAQGISTGYTVGVINIS